MSGGEHNYLYFQVQTLADTLKDSVGLDGRRMLFVDLLYDVATTAKAIEWEDSGDTEAGSGSLAIKKLFDSITASEEILVKAKRYDMITSIVEE